MENFGWKVHRMVDSGGAVFILIARGEWNGIGDLMRLREEAVERTRVWCMTNLHPDWTISEVSHIAAINVRRPEDAFAFKMRWC